MSPPSVLAGQSSEQWMPLQQAFPANRLLASATLDRLRHNAYCLTLDGASYRAPRQGPNKAKTALASTPKNIDS